MKEILKNQLLRSCLRIKLKHCRIVSNNSLYKKVVFIAVVKHFGCYGNLKFPLTYNGKSENWYLLLSHCSYFDKRFAEMFVGWSSTKHIIWDQTSQFDWQANVKFAKKCLKITSSEAIRGIKLKLGRIVYNISLFCCRCLSTLVAMATLNVYRLIKWRKWQLAFIAILLQIFWQSFF